MNDEFEWDNDLGLWNLPLLTSLKLSCCTSPPFPPSMRALTALDQHEVAFQQNNVRFFKLLNSSKLKTLFCWNDTSLRSKAVKALIHGGNGGEVQELSFKLVKTSKFYNPEASFYPTLSFMNFDIQLLKRLTAENGRREQFIRDNSSPNSQLSYIMRDVVFCNMFHYTDTVIWSITGCLEG